VINKKNIWFLTLFSLILALSVYYVTMPSELLLDVYNNNGETKKDTDVIDIEETDIISVYRLEQETKINEELDVLKLILLDNEASIDKKNEAYNKMQNLHKIKGLENLIEDQIDQELKLKAFVKIQDNTINVIVRNDKHDVSLANKIMNLVQKNFEEKKYISVKFE
jgi:stage III sporulation protein AH